MERARGPHTFQELRLAAEGRGDAGAANRSGGSRDTVLPFWDEGLQPFTGEMDTSE